MSDAPPLLGRRPQDHVRRPPGDGAAVGDAALTPVWRNRLGGLTFGVGPEPFDRFLKWSPPGTVEELDLAAEAARLRWAQPRHPVPEVLAVGGDEDTGTWLLTAAVPGRSAVDPVHLANPSPAVDAMAIGLRTLHDRLEVAKCPFDWRTETRVHRARRLIEAGVHDAAAWSDSLGLADTDAALALLDSPPSADLVVCHGDACAPNTLLSNGRWSGHVDLGALGVGDRWADLAVASWSLQWNFGPGWEPRFFAAYGIEADGARIRWFRALWDLT